MYGPVGGRSMRKAVAGFLQVRGSLVERRVTGQGGTGQGN